jgi:phospholipid/cholesterol/gamma-HCH transport system substrate-binding protein
MRSFASRSPVAIGISGLIVVALLLWVSFNAQKLPIIGGGTGYSAAFTEAAGLVPDDEVRIAGVKVGAVTSVSLEGSHVRVEFRVKNEWVGNRATVAIKIKTVLGRKYLALDSQGESKQDPHRQIPVSRTTAPYDVVPAFSQLSDTVGSIDTDQLAQSFEVISQAFADTPDSVRTAVDGLTRLSTTIASRDAALRDLLAHANDVTTVLAQRNGELTSLINDGAALLNELNNRRDAIRTLFVNTSALSLQLSGLVADNKATIGPALDQLNGVLTILNNNQANLEKSLALLAPFVRVFANTLGNGRWFDTYIQNFTVSGVLGLTGVGG